MSYLRVIRGMIMIQQAGTVNTEIAKIIGNKKEIVNWVSYDSGFCDIYTKSGRSLSIGPSGAFETCTSSSLTSSLYWQHSLERARTKRRHRLFGLIKKRDKNNLPTKKGLKFFLKQLNGAIDLEDLATPSTRECWDYMSGIESGDVEILSRFDFNFPTVIRLNKDGRWFVTGPSISNVFYEIDPISFRKLDTIDVISQRKFNLGDYLIRTVDQRLFYGENGVLNSELNPSTLKNYPDQFISTAVLPDFRDLRCLGNGQRGKSISDNKILLRNKEDVYAAMIDIADGNAVVGDYKATNGTMKLIGVLGYIQRIRELNGNEFALRKAMDYVISNIDVSKAFRGNRRKGRPFSYKPSALRKEAAKDVMQHDGFSHIKYGGDRILVLDNLAGRLLLSISMLGAIATFSNSGVSYVRI